MKKFRPLHQLAEMKVMKYSMLFDPFVGGLLGAVLRTASQSPDLSLRVLAG